MPHAVIAPHLARYPTLPIAELQRHQAPVNALSWAPHSSAHICTAGDDSQVEKGAAGRGSEVYSIGEVCFVTMRQYLVRSLSLRTVGWFMLERFGHPLSSPLTPVCSCVLLLGPDLGHVFPLRPAIP